MVEAQRRPINIDLAIADVKYPLGGECDAEKLQAECLALAAAHPSLELSAQAVLKLNEIMSVPVSLVPVLVVYGHWVTNPELSEMIIPRVFAIEASGIRPVMNRVIDNLEIFAGPLCDTQEDLIEARHLQKVAASRHNSTATRGSWQEREKFKEEVLKRRLAGERCAQIAKELGRPLGAVQEASRSLIRRGLMPNGSFNNPQARRVV